MNSFKNQLILLALLSLIKVNAQTFTMSSTTSMTTNKNTWTNIFPDIVLNSDQVIDGFRITITSGWENGDAIGFDLASSGLSSFPTSVTGTRDDGQFSFTNIDGQGYNFRGTADIATWQALLRGIQIKTNNPLLDTKEIHLSVSTKYFNHLNGHFYDWSTTTHNFSSAITSANGKSFWGMKGYLPTFTSDFEFTLLNGIATTYYWLGATDEHSLINSATGVSTFADHTESFSNFYWIDGPEKGTLAFNINYDNNDALSNSDRYTNNNWINHSTTDHNNAQHDHYLLGRFDGNFVGDFIDGSRPLLVEYGNHPDDTENSNILFIKKTIALVDVVSVKPTSSASSICEGESASISIDLVENQTISKWQYSIDNYSYQDIASTASTIVVSPSVSTYYRAVVNSNPTSAIQVSITDTSEGSLSVNTSNAIWTGDEITLTHSNGVGVSIQKWQVDSGSGYVDILSTNSSINYTIPSGTSSLTARVVLTNNCNSSTISTTYTISSIKDSSIFSDIGDLSSSSKNSMKAWLDATDINGDGSTFSGSTVGTWSDKSTKNNNFTLLSGSTEPTYVSASQMVYFNPDGVKTILESSFNLNGVSTSDGAELFIVLKRPANTVVDGGYILGWNDTTNSRDDLGIYRNATNSGYIVYNKNTTGTSVDPNKTSDLPSRNLDQGGDDTNVTSGYNFNFKGAESVFKKLNGNRLEVVGGASLTTATKFYLGMEVGNRDLAINNEVMVGEVLIFDDSLSDSDRSLIINYLREKWNFSFSDYPTINYTQTYSKSYGDDDFSIADDISSNSSGTITYSSTNSSVASVDENGLISLGSTGSASILITQDASGSYLSKTVTVSITVSKADPIITIEDQSKYVIEDDFTLSPSSTNSETSSYTYSSSNTNVATVSSSTGVVSIVGTGSTTITITQASSTNYNSKSTTIVITVLEDPAPTIGDGQIISYLEGQVANASIGTVSATDNGSLTYSITSGNSSGYFSIDSSTGIISLTQSGTLGASNDYETSPNSFSIVVAASDISSNTTTNTITINVSNVDDVVPVFQSQNNCNLTYDLVSERIDLSTNETYRDYELSKNGEFLFTAGKTIDIHRYVNNSWELFDQIAVEKDGVFMDIAISDDGSILAFSESNAKENGSAVSFNKVYIYVKGDSGYTLRDTIEPSLVGVTMGTNISDFGSKIELSADGTRIMLSIPWTDDNIFRVAVLNYSDSAWSLDRLFQDPEGLTYFGNSITMTPDGNTIAISSQKSNNFNGKVFVYRKTGDSWNSMGEVTSDSRDLLGGYGIKLNNNGTRIIAAKGTGNLNVYDYSSGNWTQYGNTIQELGNKIDISGDGNVILTSGHIYKALRDDWWEVIKFLNNNLRGTIYNSNDSYIIGGTDNSLAYLEVYKINSSNCKYEFSYNENQSSGATIATIPVNDDGTLTYSFTSGNDNGYFTINSSGEISLTESGVGSTANDWEYPNDSTRIFNLTVSVTDGASNTISSAVKLTLENLDDIPPYFNETNYHYLETREANSQVAIIDASDNIAISSYGIVSGNEDGYFAIDTSTGSITMTLSGTTAIVNDYQEGASNTIGLVVSLTDSSSNTATGTVNLIVDYLDTVAPVFESSTYSFTYDEKQSSGYEIGAVNASDNVAVTSYSIQSGNSNGYFEITSTGKLSLSNGGGASTASSNDYETGTNTFTLVISASDARSNTSTSTVSLSVTDVDEVAPTFSDQNVCETSLSIVASNTTTVDSELQYLEVSEDGNYAVSARYVSFFGRASFYRKVNNSWIHKSLGAKFNKGYGYGASISADGSVIAVSSHGGSSSTLQDIGVEIYELNSGGDNYVLKDFIQLDDLGINLETNFGYGVQLSSDGTTIAISDYDGNSGSTKGKIYLMTYSSSIWSLDHTFSYDGSGTSLEADSFGKHFSMTKDATILAASVRTEGNQGTVIIYKKINGTWTTIGELSKSGSQDYSTYRFGDRVILSNNGSKLFVYSAGIYGSNLHHLYEYDSGTTWNLVGGAHDEYVYNLDNSTTNSFLDYSGDYVYIYGKLYKVSSSGWSQVMTFSKPDWNLFDFNSDGTTFYSLEGSPFQPSEYVFNTYSQTSGGNCSYLFSYNENRSSSDVLGTVRATDASSLSYSISSGNDSGYFTVNSSGEISLTEAGLSSAVNDYETGSNSFELVVTASDELSNQTTSTVTLSLTDVDDTNPVFNTTSYTYYEDRSTGAQIATLDATDNVGITSFSIISGNDNGYFEIDSSGNISITQSGAQSKVNDFIYGENNTASIVVSIADALSNTVTATINLNVDLYDVEAPIIGSTSYNFSYDENQNSLYEIGTISATDNKAIASYAISSGNADGFFDIDANGTIFLTSTGSGLVASNDYETGVNSFTLVVSVSDQKSNTASTTVTIIVTNINDLTPEFELSQMNKILSDESFSLSLVSSSTGLFTYRSSNVDVATISGTLFQLIGLGSSTIEVTQAADENYQSKTLTATLNVMYDTNSDRSNFSANVNSRSIQATEQVSSSLTLSSFDLESDAITYSVVNQPSNGTVVIDGNVLTYVSTSDTATSDIITYKAYDGGLYSNISTITITIDPVNDAPVTSAVSAQVTEQVQKSISLNAVDVESNSLTYSIVSGPSNGTATISGSVLSYVSTSDTAISDVLTYKANDGELDSNVSTVTITIDPVSDAPVSSNISASATEQIAKEITLQATDVEGDSLSYSIVDAPLNGTATVLGNVLTYSSTSDTATSDIITYKAYDGGLYSNISTITITIDPINDAPVTSAVSAQVTEQVSKEIQLVATDVDGDELTYSIVSGPSNGTATISGSVLSYVSTSDTAISDVLTYKANDGELDSNVSTVTIAIESVNDAPSSSNINAQVTEQVSKEIQLVATDVEGDELIYSIVSGPSNGTATISGNVLTYISTSDTATSDEISYMVSDGKLNSLPSIIVIDIDPVNDIPQIDRSKVETKIRENHSIGTAITSLGISDLDGDDLTYSIASVREDHKLYFSIIDGVLYSTKTFDYDYGIREFSIQVIVSDGKVSKVFDFKFTLLDFPNPYSVSHFGIHVMNVEFEDLTNRLNYSSMITASVGDSDIRYEISGGADAEFFTINPDTGALNFIEAPDYENPLDANRDNIYEVDVKAINLIDDSNQTPMLSSTNTFYVPESNTMVLPEIEVSMAEDDVDTDNDGVLDVNDNCPNTYNPNQSDADGDGVGDVCDDSDADGVLDLEDAFPLDPTESLDTDHDGIGNNADFDDDGDGFSDADEISCGTNPLNFGYRPLDMDGDGIADCIDADRDGDGVENDLDVFPDNPYMAYDNDGDGIGDEIDADDDNDGVIDSEDAFPLDPAEQSDVDNDGIGDNADTDIYNDGFEDSIYQVSELLTPNTNTLESKWIITNLELYPNTRVMIYNTNGTEVYRSSNYKNDWDGSFNGRKLPSGSYLYKVYHPTTRKEAQGWLFIAY